MPEIQESTPIQALYQSLSSKQPQIKERGFDGFVEDMKDDDNSRALFESLSKQQPEIGKRGYDGFKADMFGGVQEQPTERETIYTPQVTTFGDNTQPSLINPIPTTHPDLSAKHPEYFAPKISDSYQSEKPTVIPQGPGDKFQAIDEKQLQKEVGGATIDSRESLEDGGFGTELGLKAQRGANALNQMLVNTPNTLIRLSNMPFNYIYKAIGLPEIDKDSFNKMTGLDKVDKNLDLNNSHLSQRINWINPKSETSLIDAAKSGDWSTFGRNLAGAVVENMPTSIAIMAAAPAIGATASTLAGSAIFGSQKLKEIDKLAPNMPEPLKLLIGYSNGALEGFFESTMGSGAVAEAMKKLVLNEGKEVAKEAVMKGFRKGFSELFTKYPLLTPLGEGYEEWATQVSQNYIDKVTGYKPKLNMFDGALENAIIGIASGSAHSLPLLGLQTGVQKAAEAKYKGRIQKFVDNFTDQDGNIQVTQSPDGIPYYIHQEPSEDGRIVGTSTNGESVYIDPKWGITSVKSQEVFDNIMKDGGNKQPSKDTQTQNQETPQLTVDPRQAQEATFRQMGEEFAHKETGLITVVQKQTPGTEENIPMFVVQDAGDGSYLLQDDQGNREWSTKELLGQPQEMSVDDFTAMKMAEFDQNNQKQELLKKNQIQIDGIPYILTGDQTNKGYVAVNPEDGSDIAIPANMVDNIRNSGKQNANIVKQVYGKTNVTGIKNEDGSLSVSDPATEEQANALKEEVEKSTGGKATVQAELIPNEDATAPQQFQLSIIPASAMATPGIINSEAPEQNNLQSVTSTPSGDNGLKAEPTEELLTPANERPVITQQIGKDQIDFVEGEDFDEVVPTDKMPLEKALPILEKKFKDHPKVVVVSEKVQVEVPGKVIKGETKWDDDVVEPSTTKTVIKSIKIVPKEVIARQKQADTDILLDILDEYNATPQSRSDKQKGSEIEAIAKKLGYQTERTPMNEIRLFDNSGTISKPKVSEKSNSENANSEKVSKTQTEKANNLLDTLSENENNSNNIQQNEKPVENVSQTKEDVKVKLLASSEFAKNAQKNLIEIGQEPSDFIIGGMVQDVGNGGFASGNTYFKTDGTIVYVNEKGITNLDSDGNIISTTVLSPEQQAIKNYEDKLSELNDNILFLEKQKDSEQIKYVTEEKTDVIGNRTKVKRLRTETELAEVKQKIDDSIEKRKAELKQLQDEKPLESNTASNTESGEAANKGENTPQAQQGQGNEKRLEENVNEIKAGNPESREELELRLQEERKQRILSEGTSFDREFNLIHPKDIKSADDVISNVNKIITTLKENEGNGKFRSFEGFASNGNYSKNAGDQIREYFIALDVLPDELRNDMRKAFSDNLKINNVQELMDWAAKQYKQTASAVPPVATISQTPGDYAGQIEQAVAEVNTNPTEAQKEAGNYKKAHVTIQGMDITIENPKGFFRSGKDEDGKAWNTEMKSHYGYFKQTTGKDGDHIDTFIGDNPESKTVFVVDQNNPKTGQFDESKVMLGYNSPEEAKAAYLANYEPGWNGFGSITPVSVDDFKTWLYDGAKQRKPFAEYSSTPEPVQVPKHTEEQKVNAHNVLVGLIEDYNSIPRNHTNKRSKAYSQIQAGIQRLGYQVSESNGKLEVLNNGKKIQRIGIKQSAEDIQAHKALTDYPEEVQSFVNHFLSDDTLLFGLDLGSSKKQIDQGIKNILEGKNTVASNEVLDSFESMFKDGVVRIKSSGVSGYVEIPVDEYFQELANIDNEIDVENELNTPDQIDEWLDEKEKQEDLLPLEVEEVENEILNNDVEENINPEGQDQSPENNQGDENAGSNEGEIPGKAEVELTPLEKEIQSLQDERVKLESEKASLVKKVNSRNGIFGDLKADPNNPLAGAGFDASAGVKRMNEINARISVIDKTIEDLTAKNEQVKATAEKENAGQQELVIPEKPEVKEPWQTSQLDYYESDYYKEGLQKSRDLFSKIEEIARSENKDKRFVLSPEMVTQFIKRQRATDFPNKQAKVLIEERDNIHLDHKELVKQALSEGKPVPEEVLNDYPELKKVETPKPLLKVLADGKKQVQEKKQSTPLPEEKQTTVFPKEHVTDSFSHVHMSPHNTAKVEEAEWNNNANELQETIKKYVPEISDEKLNGIIDQYKADYLKNREGVWRAASITVSSAVAGRSNFNAKQADQRGNALDRAYDTFNSWNRKEVARIKDETGVVAAELAEEIKKAEAKEKAKAGAKVILVKKWNDLKVGDKLDLGNPNGNPTIAKKNKFSVETGPNTKWTLKEIYGIDHAEAQKIMDDLAGTPEVKAPEKKVDPIDVILGYTYKSPESFNEKSFDEFNRALAKGEVGLTEFKKAFEVLLSSKDAIISELNGMTKAELLKGMSGMGQYRYKNEKKDATVKAIWSDHLMDFAFGSISYSFDGTSMDQIVAKKVAGTTQKNIDDFVAETQKRKQEYIERVQEFKKALTNPETLPEFKIFIDKNGLDKLSPEQKAAYDNLVTDKTIERRNEAIENKAVVGKVDLAGVEMDITETKHTKTGADLFVVKLSERVSKEDYQDLNSKAKQLGGYYSSFRGQGAVPGFQFKTREQAQKFVDLKKEDASNLDLIEEKQDTKLADRVSKLRDNAQKIIDRVDTELSRDRLTNTAKRASQAASTEARLGKEKQIAQTMMNIADAIENGDVKLLDGIKAKTHIELLDGLINQAKYKEISADSPTYSERMAREGEPATVKTVEYAQDSFYPKIYADHIKSLIDKVGDRSGVKLIASRWSKKLASTKSHDYFKVSRQSEVDELTDMVNALRGNEKSYNRVAEEIANYNRLKSMGIENDSMLRAALREYVQYRGKSQGVDKVKKLERALVGRKNIGIDFFPTPKETAQLMVDEAGITEGMDVLEPSAGNGNIADAIKETGVQPDVIELSSALSEVLEAKGYDVVASDFMDFNGKKYDRIVMNPPFSNGMDGDHVMHAYKLLKPGGKIVAIVGEGTFIRNDKKAVAFREWLNSVGGTEEKLEQGTFQDKTLLNTTGANARMVIIEKGEGVNFRILGETGAANLDKAEEATTRLDNLAVAREMEVGNENPFKDISINPIEKDYDLSEDTQSDFEYDLINVLGRKLGGGSFDYQRKGDVIIRVKGHTPNWDNFNEDIQDKGVKAILNITVGDYNNTDYRRNKTSKERFEEENPDVNIIDIEIEDGESLSDAVKTIKTLLDTEAYHSKPKDAKSIRLATGWEKGVDGKWRYEVPDSELKLTFDEAVNIAFEGQKESLSLPDVLNDEEIFTAYPSLKETKIYLYGKGLFDNTGGVADASQNFIRIGLSRSDNQSDLRGIRPDNRPVFAYDNASFQSVLSHEVQHIIQFHEGFVGGGTVEGILDRITEDTLRGFQETGELAHLDDQTKRGVARSRIMQKYGSGYGAYRSLSGEVESRNVQTRMNMTPEERRNALLSETEDVAREDQIVLMEGFGVSNLEGDHQQLANDIDETFNYQNEIAITDKDGAADMFEGVLPADVVNNIRNGNWEGGFTVRGKIIIHSGLKHPGSILSVLVHEKSHIQIRRVIPIESDRIKYFSDVFTRIAPNELKRVIGTDYSEDPEHVQAEEYYVHLTEELAFKGELPESVDDQTKKHIFDILNGFTTLKNIQDVINTKIRNGSNGGRIQSDTRGKGNVAQRNTSKNKMDTETSGALPESGGVFRKGSVDRSIPLTDLLSQAKQNVQAKKSIPNTILINGVSRPTLNSNGKPIANSEEGIRNFYRWFGDSKVVDAEGRPLVVYHGTNNDFSEFKTKTGRYFFTDNQNVAKRYRDDFVFKEDKSVGIKANEYDQFKDDVVENSIPIIEAYLKIENPKVKDYEGENWLNSPIEVDIDKSKDGLIAKNIIDGNGIIATTFIAFNPSQIKSATGNNSSFNPDDNNINFKKTKPPIMDYMKKMKDKVAEKRKAEPEPNPNPNKVRNSFDRFRTLIQDNLQAIKNLQEKFGLSITPYSNVYFAANQKGSKAMGKMEQWVKRQFKPVLKVISQLEKETGANDDEVSIYINAAHSPERNKTVIENHVNDSPIVKNLESIIKKVDAIKISKALRKYKAAQKKALNEGDYDIAEVIGKKIEKRKAIIEKAKSEKIEKTKIKLEKAKRSVRNSFNGDNDNFSGFTTNEANKIIKEFEGKANAETVNKLWEAINEANDRTSKMKIEYGLTTQEQYDKMKTNGWKRYVPKMGWRTEEDDIELDYEGGEGKGELKGMHKMKQRGTISDDPIANMYNVANSVILMGEKNKVSRTLWNLIRTNPGRNDLFEMAQVYYMTDKAGHTDEVFYDQNGTYVDEKGNEQPDYDISTFDINDKDGFLIKTFVGKKSELQKNHEFGMTSSTEYRKHKEQWKAKQHEVRTVINGRNYTMITKDPAIANAVNGENTIKPGRVLTGIAKYTRFKSKMVTTFSPYFVIKNTYRDFFTGLNTVFIENGVRASFRYLTQYPKAAAFMAANLADMDATNPTEVKWKQWYDEYNLQGSRTGHSYLIPLDDVKADIKKKIAKLRREQKFRAGKYVNPLSLLDAIAAGAEYGESIARFTAYTLARSEGKSIPEATNAAKNITTNFDVKGAVAPSAGSIMMFFNARVQGATRQLNLAKHHPYRYAATVAARMAMGFMLAALWDMMNPDDDEKDYKGLGDYTKHTNNFIGFADDYVIVPLAQGFRLWNSIGVILYEVYKEKINSKEAAIKVADVLSQEMSPVDMGGIFDKDGNLSSAKIAGTVFSAITPITDWAVNENFMNKPIYKEPFTKNQEDKIANSQMFGYNTNFALRAITDANFKAGGGNPNVNSRYTADGKEIPWYRDINPTLIEHTIKGATGGPLPEMFFESINLLAASFDDDFRQKMADEESRTNGVDKNTIPLVNQFYKSKYTGLAAEQFREIYNYGDALKDRQSKGMKTYDVEDIMKTPIDQRKFAEEVDQAKTIIDDMVAAKKQTKDLQTKKDIDSEILKVRKEIIEKYSYLIKEK